MYLVAVEGGDGAGKGEAVRILTRIFRKMAFPGIIKTHQPRRTSTFGKLAMDAVRQGDRTPIEEAGLFAADRLDHSIGSILPDLERGHLVISDRNVHSSLVYQGLVGGVGVEQVAALNSAAAVPDLVIWVDCDPEKAMARIGEGTLRALTKGQGEYFETTELQHRIRRGFTDVFTSSIVPSPFDRSVIIGPILNEGSINEFRAQLAAAIRTFLRRHPDPLNVDSSRVDERLLEVLMDGLRDQQRLPGAPADAHMMDEAWLDGAPPWKVFERSLVSWDAPSARSHAVPSTPLARSVWSIWGTLSMMGTVDVTRLHASLGPVRMVTMRHTHRIVRFLEMHGHLHRQQPMVRFAEGRLFRLKPESVAFGRLCIVLWPMLQMMRRWHREHPTSTWEVALDHLIPEATPDQMAAMLSRINAFAPGTGGATPQDAEDLSSWWRGG